MSLGYVRPALLILPLATVLLVSGCTSEEKGTGSAKGQDAAEQADAKPANIPILQGFKYYVAGPVMKKDVYGRYRITDFQGEVAQPPSRGLIFGVKREGERFEYKVWANGRLVGGHKGVIRDGLYWPEYREGYRDQKLVAREHITNDDAAKLMRIKVEDVDPETGEVIRTSEVTQSYTPPALPEDAEEEEDEGEAAEKAADGGTGEEAAPAAAAPSRDNPMVIPRERVQPGTPPAAPAPAPAAPATPPSPAAGPGH